MTRLLNTPIIGRCENAVASSRIDMLAGLSGLNIFVTPPALCAMPVRRRRLPSTAAATAAARRLRFMVSGPLAWRLPPAECTARAGSWASPVARASNLADPCKTGENRVNHRFPRWNLPGLSPIRPSDQTLTSRFPTRTNRGPIFADQGAELIYQGDSRGGNQADSNGVVHFGCGMMQIIR